MAAISTASCGPLCCFLFAWLSMRKGRKLYSVGSLLRLGHGHKYLGLISTLLILACAFLFRFLGDKEKASILLKHLAMLAAVASVIASPWYLRNWIALGSPIYPPTPALSHYFAAKYMPAAVSRRRSCHGRQGRPWHGHDFLSFLLLPFRLTFHPANYLNGAGEWGSLS